MKIIKCFCSKSRHSCTQSNMCLGLRAAFLLASASWSTGTADSSSRNPPSICCRCSLWMSPQFYAAIILLLCNYFVKKAFKRSAVAPQKENLCHCSFWPFSFSFFFFSFQQGFLLFEMRGGGKWWQGEDENDMWTSFFLANSTTYRKKFQVETVACLCDALQSWTDRQKESAHLKN